MIRHKIGFRWLPVMALAVFGMAGCSSDSGIFDVKNPGKILDEDLNTVRGVKALVTGMSADFSVGYDDVSFLVARLGGEVAGSGSYFSTGRYRRGLMDSEDASGYFGSVNRARWVAEAGIQRMQKIEGFTFDGNELTARAYLFAGLANRWYGENFCDGAVIFSAPFETDDGTLKTKADAFNRAVPELEAAISQGTQAGRSDIVTAAHGALADVQAWLGNWSAAVTEAAQVPTDFEYDAIYSDNSSRENNVIWNESQGRYEISAFGSLAGTYGKGDPRTPWTDCTVSTDCTAKNGADGQTPHYRQEKYPQRGSDIPLVKGTTARLLEAENALRNGDLSGAMAKINEARAFYGLGPLTSDGTIGSITGDVNSMSGWDILDRERALTTWLEGRHLWDLHRWDHPFLNGGGVVYEATVDRRASCIPIADSECQTNPNAAGKCFTS